MLPLGTGWPKEMAMGTRVPVQSQYRYLYFFWIETSILSLQLLAELVVQSANPPRSLEIINRVVEDYPV